jgi:hypothetical protein
MTRLDRPHHKRIGGIHVYGGSHFIADPQTAPRLGNRLHPYTQIQWIEAQGIKRSEPACALARMQALTPTKETQKWLRLLQRLQQDKLRASMGMAIRTLALQRAMWATKHKLKAQGLKLAQFPHRELVSRAEQAAALPFPRCPRGPTRPAQSGGRHRQSQ